MEISLTDWVGYLASLGLMVSFLMKNISALRIINSIGCLLFVIYGFMLATAWPVIITNFFIMCVNVFYLTKKENIQNVDLVKDKTP